MMFTILIASSNTFWTSDTRYVERREYQCRKQWGKTMTAFFRLARTMNHFSFFHDIEGAPPV